MFEVEQKFILNEKQKEQLINGAIFIGEKTFIDEYFDTKECALTKNDIWLRKRGNEFELKIPTHDGENKFTQQYQKIEGEEKIREVFAIVPISDFESDIRSLGYESFCKCETTRKKFKKGEFVVDLDSVDFNDFQYEIAEIELLVDREEQMNEAAEKINKFAIKCGFEKTYVRGKVLEYLFRKRPEHFTALVSAGVVKEKG